MRILSGFGHGKVRDKYIVRRVRKYREQIAHVRCLTNNFDSVVGIEQCLHAEDHKRMIVGQHYTKLQEAPG